MAKKPLLFAEDHDDVVRFDPERWAGKVADPSWIPGYSEVIQANDVAQVDDLDFQNAMREQNVPNIRTKEDVFQMIGAHPQKLPVEFAWLPVSGPGGGALEPTSAARLDTYMNRKGFRLAKREDLEQHGYGTTPSMREEADGTIRRGADVALYVRSGEVARKWHRFSQKQAAEYEGKNLDPELAEGNYTAPTFEDEERSQEAIAHAPANR